MKISQKLLEKLRSKLKEEKALIEEELKKIGKKGTKLQEDSGARFPLFDGEVGGAALEKAADEIEEYSTILPIGYSLETKLQNINLALGKIKKRKYGICEKCGKSIEIKRLKVCPESKTCLKCKAKQTQ